MKTRVYIRCIHTICIGLVLVILSSCATIVYGSKQELSITSNPEGASFEIYSLSDNVLIHTGKTPEVVELKRSSGYFTAAEYRVVIKMPGHADYEQVLLADTRWGWYAAGNLFSWQIFGWLVLDPITGAMYVLEPDHIDATLEANTAAENTETKLIITTRDQFADENFLAMNPRKIN